MKCSILLLLSGLCVNVCAQSNHVNEKKFDVRYRGFDFWFGTWNVNLRKQEPDGRWNDWKKAIAKVYPILDGRAILELWEEQSDAGPSNTIVGYSLRYYNPASNDWTLWLNWPRPNRSQSGRLKGNFRHGRCEFFVNRTTSDSTSLLTRYTFSDITSNSLRWDDAFSTDGGKTWTHSWIMEFDRSAALPDWPQDTKLHTYRTGKRCTMDEYGQLMKFAGKWSGTANPMLGTGKRDAITINFYQALGGCVVMSFVQIGTGATAIKEFSLMTFNTNANKFEDGRLSSDPVSDYRAFQGEFENNRLELSHPSSVGNEGEIYAWTFVNDDILKWEQWQMSGNKKTKLVEVELRRAQ